MYFYPYPLFMVKSQSVFAKSIPQDNIIIPHFFILSNKINAKNIESVLFSLKKTWNRTQKKGAKNTIILER